MGIKEQSKRGHLNLMALKDSGSEMEGRKHVSGRGRAGTKVINCVSARVSYIGSRTLFGDPVFLCVWPLNHRCPSS